MANSIINNDNLTITSLSLGSYCHVSLQDTHDEFNTKTQVANKGAAFTASSGDPGSTDNDKLWVKLDSTGNPLGFWFHENTRGWEQFLSTPSGAIIQFAGSTAPDGWLLCDGAEYDQDVQPRLYAVISGTYNTGGETAGYFRVPDLRGRVAVGVDGSAARMTANDALTNSGGAEKHTLTTAEMAEHTHSPEYYSGYGDTLSVTGGMSPAGNGYQDSTANPGPMVNPDLSDVTGGQPHNNMPPYLIVNHIIKT